MLERPLFNRSTRTGGTSPIGPEQTEIGPGPRSSSPAGLHGRTLGDGAPPGLLPRPASPLHHTGVTTGSRRPLPEGSLAAEPSRPGGPHPGDKYRNFAQLVATERAGIDFSIRTLKRPSSVAIVAPHGGLIERGTSEIAWALAGDTCSAYSFDGMKARRNGDLHITSTHFDEPQCMALLAESATVLTVHGERSPGEVVFVGGRDAARCELLCRTLADQGFTVRRHEDPALQGTHASNICNKGSTGRGIQLELSRGLRQVLVDDTDPSQQPRLTERLTVFCAAVRQALGVAVLDEGLGARDAE